MPVWLGVALGSGVGALTRAVLGTVLVMEGWPWPTFTANVAGSFAIAFVATLSAPDGRLLLSPLVRQSFLAGFCGGFTTISIFSLESLTLWLEGMEVLAAVYVAASLAAWMLAAWAGHALAVRVNR